MSALFEANGTASLTRRIAAGVVVVVGVVLLISTFANNLFKVGPDFEEMIDDFRPMLEEEAIATAQADLTMLANVGTEFETQIVPAMSQQLGMSPEEFVGFTANNFPDVANGVQALPVIVPTFNGLIETLDSQRALFESADAIPTQDLPATTVPWGLFLAGIALIVAGVLLYKPGWLGLASVGTLGVLIIVVTLILSLIPKAADADDRRGQPALAEECAAGPQEVTGMVRAPEDQRDAGDAPAECPQNERPHDDEQHGVDEYEGEDAQMGRGPRADQHLPQSAPGRARIVPVIDERSLPHFLRHSLAEPAHVVFEALPAFA